MTFFNETKLKKLETIEDQRCEIFLDDLPEIFMNSAFPETTAKLLFDPFSHHSDQEKIFEVSDIGT